mgnify:CR=1 FL=1
MAVILDGSGYDSLSGSDEVSSRVRVDAPSRVRPYIIFFFLSFRGVWGDPFFLSCSFFHVTAVKLAGLAARPARSGAQQRFEVGGRQPYLPSGIGAVRGWQAA